MTEDQQNAGLKSIANRIADLLDGTPIPNSMRSDDVTITLTRQDISALAAGLVDVEITPKSLVFVQSALMERNVVFISLPKDGVPFYYVTHLNNATLRSAIPVSREQRDLIITRSNTSMANIQLLATMGFGKRDLFAVTCKSVGHSAFGLVTQKGIACARCGAKHTKARIVLTKDKAPSSQKEAKLFVTWRDVIHLPESSKEALFIYMQRNNTGLVSSEIDEAGSVLLNQMNSQSAEFVFTSTVEDKKKDKKVKKKEEKPKTAKTSKSSTKSPSKPSPQKGTKKAVEKPTKDKKQSKAEKAPKAEKQKDSKKS